MDYNQASAVTSHWRSIGSWHYAFATLPRVLPHEIRLASWKTLPLVVALCLQRQVEHHRAQVALAIRLERAVHVAAGARRLLGDESIVKSLTEAPSPPPSFLVRHWLRFTVWGTGMFLVFRFVVPRVPLLTAVVRDLRATALLFVRNYVVSPLCQIYETIRHSDSTAQSLVGDRSLETERESLTRMMVDFSQEIGDKHTNVDNQALLAAIVAADVVAGDLSMVNRVVEDEMKSPLRNAFFGHIIRSVIIQMQKAKVDAQASMAAMDKLLRANELTFAMISAIPALFSLSYVWNAWLKWLGRRGGASAASARRSMSLALRHLDRLLVWQRAAQAATVRVTEGASLDHNRHIHVDDALLSMSKSNVVPFFVEGESRLYRHPTEEGEDEIDDRDASHLLTLIGSLIKSTLTPPQQRHVLYLLESEGRVCAAACALRTAARAALPTRDCALVDEDIADLLAYPLQMVAERNAIVRRLQTLL